MSLLGYIAAKTIGTVLEKAGEAADRVTHLGESEKEYSDRKRKEYREMKEKERDLLKRIR